MTRARRILLAAGPVAAVALAALAIAQIEGNDRGVPPVDSSNDYEVSGIAVDVSARTAGQARNYAWRLAQRRGWQALWAKTHGGAGGAPALSDGELDAMVAGIAVEDERIGPTRYIAHLGVLFDRARAGGRLGTEIASQRSVPTLVVPIMWSGGVVQSFEHRTEWQKAWARFRTGGSAIDYVRPVGTGIDSLVLTYGQATRPGRARWRALLDHYGAADVVMPVVQILRRFPGGPVTAHFTALHGPDAQPIAQFDLTAPDGDALPRMLDEGVRRIDAAYTQALRDSRLGADASLTLEPVAEPALPDEAVVEAADAPAAALPGATTTFVVQVDTADDGALAAAEASMRGIPGVARVATDSVALGGVSVLRVGYGGDPQVFRTQLVTAGWQVEDAGGGLRLRRAGPR